MTEDVAAAAAPEAVEPTEAPSEALETPTNTDPEPKSLRDTLNDAFKTVDEGEPAKEAAADKPEPVKDDAADKADKPDDQAARFTDAPSRFSADAKSQWANAPESVRAEITRAVSEMEAGLKQYQDRFAPYADIDKQLQQTGQKFQDVVAHYTGIEKMLAEDPIKGMQQIARNLGTSLEAIAAQVTGKTPDQQAHEATQRENALIKKIEGLEKRLGTFEQDTQQQRTASVETAIMEFAAKPEHARFDELSTDILAFMNSHLADEVASAQRTGKFETVLAKAYEMAERLNPAANPQPDPTPQPEAAQTRKKGKLSPSGAPNGGSNPASRTVPPSAGDAVRNAFKQVGL
jgi:DNA-binding transcriptional MerR regulator